MRKVIIGKFYKTLESAKKGFKEMSEVMQECHYIVQFSDTQFLIVNKEQLKKFGVKDE